LWVSTSSPALFVVLLEIANFELFIDPLLMNAFNTVNLSASCVLTSTDYARKLGIPEERWIYPLGGAGTNDSEDCMVPLLFPYCFIQNM
jgi:hypothetical protein